MFSAAKATEMSSEGPPFLKQRNGLEVKQFAIHQSSRCGSEPRQSLDGFHVNQEMVA